MPADSPNRRLTLSLLTAIIAAAVALPTIGISQAAVEGAGPPAVDRAGWTYGPLTAPEAADLRERIDAMKRRERGPFERIRWFCADGSVLAPVPYACREHGGGRQHGEYTADALALHARGFHVGPVLAATGWDEFFDLANSHYFLRELVLQGFLEDIDDGWVMRRARYYRGARQAESEEAVGREFLERLLGDTAWLQRNYLLAARLVARVPHGIAGVASDAIRGLALQISDADPGFMRLRVKIHSTPGAEDLPAVTSYLRNLPATAAPGVRQALVDLEDALRRTYSPGEDDGRWTELGGALQATDMASRVAGAGATLRAATSTERVAWLAALLHDAREEIGRRADASGAIRLAVLDTVRYAQARLFVETGAWSEELRSSGTRRDLIRGVRTLADAAHGGGWLSEREHRALEARIDEYMLHEEPNRATYLNLVRYLGRSVEWGTAAADQMVAIAMDRYVEVEPRATMFADDAVRGSVLLTLAQILEALEADAATEAGLSYVLGDQTVQTGVLGLNPGVAVGTFRVIDSAAEIHDLDPDGIYVLPETPADLGRVAGILTVDQGSRLSHVQLLARGLGIPNAAIASQHLPQLRVISGQRVIYAVSPLGSLILRPVDDLDPAEVERMRQDAGANAPRVTIDTSALDLTLQQVLPLEAISSADSGRLAGPKAANLGQLHEIFPGRVAPGLVIPFGVFRAHMDQDLDGDGRSLYEETREIYRDTADPGETVRRLAELAERIRRMPLLPRFEQQLLALLRARFELHDGVGVFVRSDTNVEDLPGFSGAGLNLTVMNVVGEQEILQAVRDVWASPYRERSYAWRQRVITNPEAVYPSILILGSIAAEASGVLVTEDVDGALTGRPQTGPADGWTVTLAEGIGGAVDGEATETLVLPARPGAFEPVLLSSARAPWRKTLSMNGGIGELPAFGDTTLITPARLRDLTSVIQEIEARYPRDEDTAGRPWDVEFGFVGDETILFQIRPFIRGAAESSLAELRELDDAVVAGSNSPVDLEELLR